MRVTCNCGSDTFHVDVVLATAPQGGLRLDGTFVCAGCGDRREIGGDDA